jgi:peroxiredoxin
VELQRRYGEFQARGVEAIALAVAPLEAVEGVRSAVGASFPILADPEHRVAEMYGVYNLLGDGLAAPSVFVLRDGRIHWAYVGRDSTDRPSVDEILSHLPGP